MQNSLSRILKSLAQLVAPRKSSRRAGMVARPFAPCIEQIEQRIVPALVMAPVTDINTDVGSMRVDEVIQIGEVTYFAAFSEDLGRELWRTDGTPEGTRVVSNIARGTESSSPHSLTEFNGLLYFAATTSDFGTELWRTDGTPEGTQMVADLNAGAASSNPAELTSLNGRLIFAANNGVWGNELWTTTGDAQNLSLISNIHSSGNSNPASFTAVGTTLYFTANNGVNGVELFRTNGLPGNAQLVTDLRAGSASSSPTELTTFGDRLYFIANSSSGNQVWRTNPAGTSVSQVTFQTAGKSYDSPGQLSVASGQLFLSAYSTGIGQELHVIKTHSTGVEPVRDIRSGSNSSYPQNLVAHENVLFFSATDSNQKTALWRSDGTTAGTLPVTSAASASTPSQLTSVDSTLFFVASDTTQGRELWAHSVTNDSSAMVTPYFESQNAHFEKLTNVNGSLYFSTGRDSNSATLWRYNRTANETQEVFRTTLNANPGFITNGGINVSYRGEQAYAEVNGILYFAATSSTNGIELWRSDGTQSGTWMVKDLRPGSQNSTPRNFTNVNGTLYFTAYGESGNSLLWKSDGTADGTTPVLPAVGQILDSPDELVSFAGRLYFQARAGATVGTELWVSDGSTAGTHVLRDIAPGSGSSNPSQLTVVGNRLFFVADNQTSGRRLWMTNGSENGTVVVPNGPASPTQLTVMGGNLFSISQSALYVTSGDGSSTTTLNTNVIAQPMTATDDLLYFTAINNSGAELWKTNGSVNGTGQVADINPGPQHSMIANLTSVGNRVFFSATDESGNAEELWVSNGSAGGTHRVKDISPGTNSSYVQNPISFNDELFFVATDGTHGLEVWRSDGTETGTQMVSDNLPGNDPSLMRSAEWLMPRIMTAANGRLFLSATNGISGHELYTIGESTGPSGPPAIISPVSDTISQTPVFSWSEVSGASSYELWIHNQSTDQQISVPGLQNPSWQPISDLGIAVYHFRVRAIGANGQITEWSPEVEFNIDTKVSVQMKPATQATSRPDFSWNELPGAVRYDVWIDNLSTGTSQYLRNTNVVGTEWTASTDFPVGRYRAWVRGIDNAGIPARWSSLIDIHVVPAPTPLGPEFATFSRRPTFSWTAIHGAASYDVWLQNLNTGVVTYYQKNIASLSWTTPQQLVDGYYRWWVQARSPQNQLTLWSRPVNVYIGGQPIVSGPVGSTNNARPVFTWSAVGGAVRYELWVSNAANVRVVNQTNLTSTSFAQPSSLAAGTYRVWVRAFSSSGEISVWSRMHTFSIN